MASQALFDRYNTIQARLEALESHPAFKKPPSVALEERQLAILERIGRLAAAVGIGADSALAPAPTRPRPTVTPDASPIQQKLEQELIDKGFSHFRFVRVPGDYYDQSLEVRRECLSAASVDHLCKSIVMENTRAHESVTDWSDPRNSKYYCIIVQYTARLHADKLKMHIMELGGRRFGRQYYNMRLAPEEVNDALTGYSHNAVSPIAMKERLPIVLSHKIAQLQPEEFFLGAGEVDLKVGLSVKEFIEAYDPFILDCTYD